MTQKVMQNELKRHCSLCQPRDNVNWDGVAVCAKRLEVAEGSLDGANRVVS